MMTMENDKKRHVVVFLLLVILLVLTGCWAGSTVTGATAEDWVWGVEDLESGAARAWLRHDDIAGYCTSDPQLATIVREAIGARVRLSYESSRVGDKELWNSSGCNRLYTGDKSSTPIFRITAIEILARD